MKKQFIFTYLFAATHSGTGISTSSFANLIVFDRSSLNTFLFCFGFNSSKNTALSANDHTFPFFIR